MAGGELTPSDAEAAEEMLLPPPAGSDEPAARPPPADRLGIGYLIFFTLGAGFLVPWNAFITAVDYFSYLYPGAPVDRVFSVAYMVSCFIPLVLIVLCFPKSSAPARINTGLSLFTLALLVVPVMDTAYVKGVPGLYGAFDVTVAATVLCGVADALVQGGVIGFAGELPERYMQAVVAGTAASGVLVSALRVITKAVYPQDAHGLRKSAILYFVVSIVVMVICVVCYNLAYKLPVVVYYKNIKKRAEKAEEDGGIYGSTWRSTLWSIVGRVKWHGIGVALIYAITLSIFPGYITEDVHSESLKDWYPIMLITAYNVFDLLGKSVPAVYSLQNANIAVAGSFARLLFYPLFYGCLHGPSFFRTEFPVTILTCLLGLTNGYLTCILMTLAPKAVPIQHSETAGIVIVLFLVTGLVIGSFVAWFWVIDNG
ncbi:hypothetical protein GUJ93_ZPchr0010g8842 [Zizania palustris]|uniref:Equilibrative nucleotide transporter 1 n=1 Tax=Zizania palustris TaxID=103762 RepID=A0A8J6BEB4_ZIZPA|nr:hypothetical protein GUJ93_ZPchr0010g8842 [Zizania palustris]KAG8085620.1 hypothetical protein GUJ93_ZPchr0010g8842 [Zizania palustris]